ncbi:hypothetical protein [Nostoc sp.]|uniref:hypothetical protein n=1 Tax=Nostoc sp. TaxID=1180 RepID=UPI002FFCD8FB
MVYSLNSELHALNSNIRVCCDRLRYHPIFTNPQTEEAKAACEVCRKYVWSKVSG